VDKKIEIIFKDGTKKEFATYNEFYSDGICFHIKGEYSVYNIDEKYISKIRIYNFEKEIDYEKTI
jgi:hypothetical protein